MDHQQWQEKDVKHVWFHVVSESLQSGLIAKIGAVPWAVYCVIKSHAGLETGNAWPSNARIGELVGVSVNTVQRAMKTLLEADLIKADRSQGRVNRYSVTESIKIDEKDGTPWKTGERKYVPVGFGDFVDQLKRLAKTGNMPTDKEITINITIVQGDNNTVQSYNVEAAPLPPS